MIALRHICGQASRAKLSGEATTSPLAEHPNLATDETSQKRSLIVKSFGPADLERCGLPPLVGSARENPTCLGQILASVSMSGDANHPHDSAAEAVIAAPVDHPSDQAPGVGAEGPVLEAHSDSGSEGDGASEIGAVSGSR